MFNKLKLGVFWLFQMFFLFYAFFYTFEMYSVKKQATTLITGTNDSNFINIMQGYLPDQMFSISIIALIFIVILTVLTNFTIFKKCKKWAIAVILLSASVVAFLSFCSYQDNSYAERANTQFAKIYSEASGISTGTDKALIENAKTYQERYSATPSDLNRIKFQTAYQTLLYKMKDLRTIKVEQIGTFNEVLKLHVSYVSLQEKLLNSIQLYIVMSLIFLALIRIKLSK